MLSDPSPKGWIRETPNRIWICIQIRRDPPKIHMNDNTKVNINVMLHDNKWITKLHQPVDYTIDKTMDFLGVRDNK